MPPPRHPSCQLRVRSDPGTSCPCSHAMVGARTGLCATWPSLPRGPPNSPVSLSPCSSIWGPGPYHPAHTCPAPSPCPDASSVSICPHAPTQLAFCSPLPASTGPGETPAWQVSCSWRIWTGSDQGGRRASPQEPAKPLVRAEQPCRPEPNNATDSPTKCQEAGKQPGGREGRVLEDASS